MTDNDGLELLNLLGLYKFNYFYSTKILKPVCCCSNENGAGGFPLKIKEAASFSCVHKLISRGLGAGPQEEKNDRALLCLKVLLEVHR